MHEQTASPKEPLAAKPVQPTKNQFGINEHEMKALTDFKAGGEQQNKIIVFLVGVILSPFTLIGALLGYMWGYNKILRPAGFTPNFYPITPPVRMAMIIGGVSVWVSQLLLGLLIVVFIGHFDPALILGWVIAFAINTLLSFVVWVRFRTWRIGVNNAIVQSSKFGTARFANVGEVTPYANQKGIFIGDQFRYEKQGHILTIAGSRSGKFTNLIAPNLLGASDVDGSWVVVDPKGEICAVTHKYQAEIGQDVVVLNPWGLIGDHVPQGRNYNPLDILDVDSPHLVDDCYMLAEMLVPVETGKNKFFSDSARTIVSGIIMYIAITKTGEERNLKTLWKIVRYPDEMWERVISEMNNWTDTEKIIEGNENEDDFSQSAESLLLAANEIEKLTKSGSNTWGSILSTVLQATDFLKSPALQKCLQSDFDPALLANGNVTLYVIIPADKLQSHSRWLRLVVTSTMRAVIRKPNKRVCFMLDEFAALGYLPEIETALSTYAGFNVTVWPILQSLVQLQSLYEKSWEVFIGNTAVRHFFGLHNNFDTLYVANAIGKTSHVITSKEFLGKSDAVSTERYLITPDELRIASGSDIFTFIDDIPPFYVPKEPYYLNKVLNERAGENPYIK